MINNFFFENHAAYEIMWKNIVEPGRPQKTIWRMRISHWTPRATNTHSEYVILIAFHCSSGCTNAPLCSVKRALPAQFSLCSHNVDVLRYSRKRITLPGSTVRCVVKFCNTKVNMLCRNRFLEYVLLCVLQNCYIIGNVKYALTSRPTRSSVRQLRNKLHRLALPRATHTHTHTHTHTSIFKGHNLSMRV